VLAEEIERIAVSDERLNLVTITAVEADPDYRRAKVLFSELSEEATAALASCRPRLQSAVARQVRMKWTPTLSFVADPAVAEGRRVEEILRKLNVTSSTPTSSAEPASSDSPAPSEDPPPSEDPASLEDPDSPERPASSESQGAAPLDDPAEPDDPGSAPPR
jgi:ribosome-binding factor A